MNKMETALVVDRDFLMRGYVVESLRNEGITALEAESDHDALRLLNSVQVDMVFAELKLLEKLETGAQKHFYDVGMIWVALTSFGNVDKAIDLVKQGIYDYLVKPFSPAQVSVVVLRLKELYKLQEKVTALEQKMIESSGTITTRVAPQRMTRTERLTTVNLQELERVTILRVLEETGGSRNITAKRLGISVRTLRNKLNQYRQEAVAS